MTALSEVLEERSERGSVEETYLITLEESLDIDLGQPACREVTESAKESSLVDAEPTQEENLSGAGEEKETSQEIGEKEHTTFKVQELREEGSLPDVVKEETAVEERELCEIEPFVNGDILKTLDDGKIAGDLDVSKITEGEQEALREVAGSNLSEIEPIGDEVDMGKDKTKGDVEDIEGGGDQCDVVDLEVGTALEEVVDIGKDEPIEDAGSCAFEDVLHTGKDEALESPNEDRPFETADSKDEEALDEAVGLAVDTKQVETLGKEKVSLEIEGPEEVQVSREWDGSGKEEDSVETGGPEKEECSEEMKAMEATEEIIDVPLVALEVETTEETRSLSQLSKGSSRARSDDLTIRLNNKQKLNIEKFQNSQV
ncbi:gap junction alpha-8 -like protein [Labeo rohita]|uniref:Gap junction alpha-8-like protein n=1 Tax=Labeo rohita TaxID=84645 RepID=A0A498L6X0_LABRO|nr:gap junction alpha-8 -like protein [Labeo rohita]RXN28981.1 gap junction alpha-8 -like protein [Labeo rohita]